MNPSTTIIIPTYNRPDLLKRTLAGLEVQTDMAFEIAIADDGSGSETQTYIEEYKAQSAVPVHYFWHEDKGFRKSKILNTVIRETESDLLIFFDHDTIPGKDCVALYREAYAPKRMLVGGYIRLTEEDSKKLTVENISQGFHETLMTDKRMRFLRWRHVKNLFYIYFAIYMKNRPRFMGGNFAVASDLIETVNGFDEVYEGWGKEDSDLRTRMRRAGGGARCLWHKAIVYHQWHPMNPTKPDMADNQARYNRIKSGKLPWRCERGIDWTEACEPQI